jgi:tetratricopeptide (TPR) repeat protein
MNDKWKEVVEAGNLAFSAGRVSEAEVKFQEAVKLAEEMQDNTSLALSLNNLAAIYHTQSKYKFAEELYKKALSIREGLYGHEHPEIALNLHNLAVLYSARRMYPLAEEYYKKAIDVKEKVYGNIHVELVSTYNYYAKLLKLLDRTKDLELIEEKIVEIEKSSKQTT